NKQMLPLVLDPLIPVAEEQLRENFGLNRILVALLLAFLVEGIALGEWLLRILRIDSRHEGDPLAVRRPQRVAALGGDRGQLTRLAAVHVDDPELVVAGSVRFEQNPLTVRTPA